MSDIEFQYEEHPVSLRGDNSIEGFPSKDIETLPAVKDPKGLPPNSEDQLIHTEEGHVETPKGDEDELENDKEHDGTRDWFEGLPEWMKFDRGCSEFVTSTDEFEYCIYMRRIFAVFGAHLSAAGILTVPWLIPLAGVEGSAIAELHIAVVIVLSATFIPILILVTSLRGHFRLYPFNAIGLMILTVSISFSSGVMVLKANSAMMVVSLITAGIGMCAVAISPLMHRHEFQGLGPYLINVIVAFVSWGIVFLATYMSVLEQVFAPITALAISFSLCGSIQSSVDFHAADFGLLTDESFFGTLCVYANIPLRCLDLLTCVPCSRTEKEKDLEEGVLPASPSSPSSPTKKASPAGVLEIEEGGEEGDGREEGWENDQEEEEKEEEEDEGMKKKEELMKKEEELKKQMEKAKKNEEEMKEKEEEMNREEEKNKQEMKAAEEDKKKEEIMKKEEEKKKEMKQSEDIEKDEEELKKKEQELKKKEEVMKRKKEEFRSEQEEDAE